MIRESILNKVMATAAMMFLTGAAAIADSDVTAEQAAQNTPEGWTAVQLPSIVAITDANTFDITNYGASTESSDNTAAIQAAIDAVPSTGGMVVVPAGTWLSGPITVKSNMVLHLNAGATLKLLPFGTYPSENEYHDANGSYKNLNFINNAKKAVNDIIIEGEGETSIIDGDGYPWWVAQWQQKFNRPGLIRLQKGTRHLFRNFRMENSPGTHLTLGASGAANNITVHDVTVDTYGGSPNTDGIPVWGPYVNIYDCNISTGDDNIVVDSNGNYVHAWNIKCGTGHGMSIGSFTQNVHHIIYEDIDFNGTETGFRIKTNSNSRSGNDYEGTSDIGSVHDIIFRNSTMDGVESPIVLITVYDEEEENPADIEAKEVTVTTPEYRDILFQNITATNTTVGSNYKRGNPIYIYGRPESYIHDITFDNVSVDAQKGMFMAYCKDINFTGGCQITNLAGTGDFSKRYEATYTGSYSSVSTVSLNTNTCFATKADASPWAFDGGYSISNEKGKGYDYVNNTPYIKYSAGVKYTITLPEGVYVKAVQFDGYNNYENQGDSHIAEVNGKTYSETDYVFPQDKSTVSRKIDLANTASGTLTFTTSGKQICAAITLYTTDTPTGVGNVSINGNVNKTYVKMIDPKTKRLIIAGYDETGRRVK